MSTAGAAAQLAVCGVLACMASPRIPYVVTRHSAWCAAAFRFCLLHACVQEALCVFEGTFSAILSDARYFTGTGVVRVQVACSMLLLERALEVGAKQETQQPAHVL